MTDRNKFRTELAALKRDIEARVRADTAHMSADERARYRAQLSGEQRRSFDLIMGTPHKHDAVRERLCAEMDRRMGLSLDTGSVTRSEFELRASVFGGTESRTPRAAAPRKQPLPATSRGLHPRQTANGRVTARSPEAAAMDLAMGFEPAKLATHRTPTCLTFSVFR